MKLQTKIQKCQNLTKEYAVFDRNINCKGLREESKPRIEDYYRNFAEEMKSLKQMNKHKEELKEEKIVADEAPQEVSY